jgi:hypothetical protein
MGRTRREFIKDAAIAGTAAAAVSIGVNSTVAVAAEQTPAEPKKCPFFDQPLMCDGPGADGKFKCE